MRRDVRDALIVALCVAAMLAMLASLAYSLSQPQAGGGPVENAYWPFTVETQVRDR